MKRAKRHNLIKLWELLIRLHCDERPLHDR